MIRLHIDWPLLKTNIPETFIKSGETVTVCQDIQTGWSHWKHCLPINYVIFLIPRPTRKSLPPILGVVIRGLERVGLPINFPNGSVICFQSPVASQSGEEYQQEFKPPPDGSTTGVGKQEKVLPMKDAAHDQEQIQHRSDILYSQVEPFCLTFGDISI